MPTEVVQPKTDAGSSTHAAPAAAVVEPSAPLHGVVPASQGNPDTSMDVDVNLLEMGESSFSELMGMESKPKKEPGMGEEPTLPIAAFAAVSTYDFESDEISEVRKQVAFFTKLGKIDDAIGLLEAVIRTKPESSPFLYLDLLEIANANSLKTDFRQFRDEFQGIFNVHVPEFALYKDKGPGLDAHSAVQQALAGARDTPAELTTIESYILKTSQSPLDGAFSVSAFLELLAMHAAARLRNSAHHGLTETKTTGFN